MGVISSFPIVGDLPNRSYLCKMFTKVNLRLDAVPGPPQEEAERYSQRAGGSGDPSAPPTVPGGQSSA